MITSDTRSDGCLDDMMTYETNTAIPEHQSNGHNPHPVLQKVQSAAQNRQDSRARRVKEIWDLRKVRRSGLRVTFKNSAALVSIVPVLRRYHRCHNPPGLRGNRETGQLGSEGSLSIMKSFAEISMNLAFRVPTTQGGAKKTICKQPCPMYQLTMGRGRCYHI